MAKLGYGINDKWEVFLSLGGAQTGASWTEEDEDPEDVGESTSFNADGDMGFAIGGGTKVTLYEKDALKVGGLFQLVWGSSDGKMKWTDYDAEGSVEDSGKDDVDVDFTTIQVAVGATYKVMEPVSIYGGPFWQWIDGDFEIEGSESWEVPGGTATGSYKDTADFSEDSNFGGFVGVHIDVTQNAAFNVEYQATGSSDILGFNFTWAF
jgi:hypothetical protein